MTDALPRGPTGPYQLQAAIAAIHDEAPSAEATDWPQIVALYELLLQTPITRSWRSTARSRSRWSAAHSPASPSSASSRPTSGSPKTTGSTRSAAHLLEMAGDRGRRVLRTSRRPSGP